MPVFMTTQWIPQLGKDGKPNSFRAEARGKKVGPGATVEMSDRTYTVGQGWGYSSGWTRGE